MGRGEPLTGLLIAGLVAGAFGYLTSFVIARFRHLPLIMITLGIGLLLQEAANSASWLTGGFDGLQGIHTWPIAGKFHFDLYGYTAYGYALAVLFLIFLGARRLTHSPFGLALRGIRDNGERMRAIGAPTRSHIRTVFTIAEWSPASPARCSRKPPRRSRSKSWVFNARPTFWSC